MNNSGNHGNHNEPHNTQNNISEHGTPPKGINDMLGFKSQAVDNIVAHSPQTASHSGIAKAGGLLGRHLPGGMGVAIGTAVAAEQAMSGDRIGAAMTATSTALATVPGVGTVASFAVDGVQAALQTSGAMSSLNRSLGFSQDSHKTNKQIDETSTYAKNIDQKMDAMSAEQQMRDWDQEAKDKVNRQKMEDSVKTIIDEAIKKKK